MRINYRVIIIGFIFLFLYGGVGYIYLQKSLESLYNAKYSEVSGRMQGEANVLIREKLETVVHINMAVAQNTDVKNFLLAKLKGDLRLDEYAKLINEKTPLKSIWFQVIDKNGVSRYRSWTDVRGDSLVNVRKDVPLMIQNPEIQAVISTGKFDMTFKSMVPIYSEGVFIGSLETIARFDSVAIKLQNSLYETAVFIDKKYKKQLTHTATNNFFDDYYLSYPSDSKKLMDGLLEKGVEHFTKIKDYYLDTKYQQLFSLYKVANIHGKDMGYVVMAIDLKHIDISNILSSKKRIVLTLVLGFLIIIGFLAYLYMVNYKNFIQKQQKILEESVIQKTRELQEKSEEMTHLAHHDTLTKLPNRFHFENRLQDAIKLASKLSQKVGVLFLDLDSFKEINDTYGHKTGDLLLQSITERLQSVVRENDVIARLGGDEFTVIVENSSHEVLERIAGKIILEIQKPLEIEELELFVTFSIGMSLYPDDGETTELLLKHADTAMYRAKEDGKNRYEFYNFRMTEMTLEKVTLQNELREAIAQEQFVPYFQPKIDARDGKVVGLEALVRWIHPLRGIVSPIEFIPFAEESGLIKDIDKLTLRATLKEVKLWHKEGLKSGIVSVNISTKQLQDFVCVESFKNEIDAADFDSSYLEIEVTESQIMKNQRKATEILRRFKELGLTISIDDFGTGYSSLSYLKHLPVDKLKIDQSFVRDTPQSSDDVAIVKTIIALAKNLNLDIIAEGVETQEQVDFLMREGCYFLQGYYYSKPLSATDFKAFLLANS
jgi:diguanylate cyclase (GGDEF)-like protein